MSTKDPNLEFPHVFVPIYKTDRRTGLPEHIGTGFLLGSHSGHWLFTAAHVLAEHKTANITLPGTPFFNLQGEVSSSSVLTVEATHKDTVDLAFLELSSDEVAKLKGIGLEFYPLANESVEATQHDLGDAVCYAGGFPLVRVKADHKKEVFTGGPYIYRNRLFTQDKMRKFGHDPSYRLGVRYERLKLPDGSTFKPLPPRGMSGGPLWVEFAGKRRLAGIITDYISPKSLLLGTRLVVLLTALQKHIRRRAEEDRQL